MTQAGSDYFREVTPVLAKLEAVSTDLRRGRKLDTSLMIAAQPTFATRWLLPRLKEFVAGHSLGVLRKPVARSGP